LGIAAADRELGDDLRVQGGAAGRHPVHRVQEVADVLDPVLEQVAERAGGLRQQVGGVALLHVLGQLCSGSTEDSIGGVIQEPIPRRIRIGQTAESAAG
jgi:hypothetical protein